MQLQKSMKRNASKAFSAILNKITKAVFTPSHIYVVEDERGFLNFSWPFFMRKYKFG